MNKGQPSWISDNGQETDSTGEKYHKKNRQL